MIPVSRLTVLSLALLVGACQAPIARQWHADCVAAGYDAATCDAGARRVNSQAWQAMGQAMQSSAASMRQTQPTRPMSISCRSVETGSVTTTDCDTFP